jgi:hypothetical protein
MTLGIHAEGYMGIAFETVYGTYVPPTRFFPIKSESLVESFENQKRRVIRGIADNLGHIQGYSHVEGDVEMELMEDVLPYFLYVSRNEVAKTGTTPNFVYTTTPQHWGASTLMPKPGMSITVVKNGTVYGFTGCATTGMEFSVDSGICQMKMTMIGRAEASQALPTPTFPISDLPFSAGMYSIQVPTASQLFDVNDFTLTVNDNGEAQNRLQNSTFAQWVKFGQREVQLELERDYTDRTEWDAFKLLTAASVTVLVQRNANKSVQFKLPNAVRDTHEVDGLSDQGNPTMQRTTWEGNYDPTTSKSYEIICKCSTDITP